MIRSTGTHGDIMVDHTVHISDTDGMTHGMDTMDIMITTHGMAHGTDTLTTIITDGIVDGTHIGDIIITTITM